MIVDPGLLRRAERRAPKEFGAPRPLPNCYAPALALGMPPRPPLHEQLHVIRWMLEPLGRRGLRSEPKRT